MKPLIVISNDDGYFAPGIKLLIATLRPIADLVVVAPDSARSGYAAALTASQPISLRHESSEEGFELYVCTGTPVDCVKMAFDQLLPRLGRKADLMVSGINHGDNSSTNTYYSGTMGAATEGVFQGVPAIGFSVCEHSWDYDLSATQPWILKIVQQVLEQGLPSLTLLNVNFPTWVDEYKGVRLCRMGNSRWKNEWCETYRPGRKTPYYWLTGEREDLEPEATDTDQWALRNGYISIVPQTLDATNYAALDCLAF